LNGGLHCAGGFKYWCCFIAGIKQWLLALILRPAGSFEPDSEAVDQFGGR
jgi:hypothetical protein